MEKVICMNSRIEKILTCLVIFLFIFSVQAQNLDSNQKEIRLVLSISDEQGRYAGGLKAENIEISVGKKPQKITSFTDQNQPATIVFLIDLSGSRKGIIQPLTEEIKRFVKNANPGNEYFVLAFNTKVQTIIDKTEEIKILEKALNEISAISPKGNTAFFDSTYAAIKKAGSGKYQKKVLIACSDGADTESSLYGMNEVVKLLKQSDVLFYGIGYTKQADKYGVTELQGEANLTRLSDISGGKSLFPQTELEMSRIFDRIGLELKNQYQIGFRVEDFTKPDQWRELKVKVTPILDGSKQVKVQARTRKGFYPASAK